jgi:predicted kinase
MAKQDSLVSTKKIEKMLYLMRGLPGSGKSYLAKELAPEANIFSTDDFWMSDGEYKFDRYRLGEAHAWNKERVLKALLKGESPIVVDNTNISPRERRPYMDMAKDQGYEVQVVHPVTTWAWDIDECAMRNSHGVPREAIERMYDRAYADENFPISKLKKSASDHEHEHEG